MASALAFVALQYVYSENRMPDARALIASFICGFLLDGTLAATGWLEYASPMLSIPAPIWILTLWMAFAMTLNHSMRFLRGKPAVAALLGGFGGPLAYLGAARGFDAVVFTAPAWHAIALLAFGWALSLGALAILNQRWAVANAGATVQLEHAQ